MRLLRCFRYSRFALLALCFVVGCAPERMSITDADDLAQFAAASKVSAEKRIAVASTPKAETPKTSVSKTLTSAVAPPLAPPQVAKKPELDAESRAFLNRISKEQNFDAAKMAEFEEALASLSPELRSRWVAGEEAKLNKGKAATSFTPPRELPSVVKADPMPPKGSEIQQAEYRQPAKETADAAHAESELAAELRSLKEKFTAMMEFQQRRDAEQEVREAQKALEERQKAIFDTVNKRGSVMSGLIDPDHEGGGSSLPGINTSVMQAEFAAAMAKSNPKKSDKKAPLPGDALSVGKPESVATSSTPTTLSNANLEQLWNQISGGAANDPSLSLAMRKKIFLLVAGDMNAASTPPESFTPAEKQYWMHLMRVLDLSVKLGDHPRRDRQAALVGRELREATSELESASVLDLQNATFCSSVQAFGNYVEFENATFKPNEEVVLYVEVQNFASKQRDDGKAFETDLHGAYQILDASGKRVADLDLPTEHGVCRQRRRDYFFAYRMHLPKGIDEGEYTLQLTMEDKNSGKFGQTTLKFVIRK